MEQIKLHSITDLITNSSTVIFTYSDGTIKPLKEMVNEMLKTFNTDKTFDEVFDAVVLNEDWYTYRDYFEEHNNDYPEGIDENTDFEKLYDEVASGKIEKPIWFDEVEEAETRHDYYRENNVLCIIPKDEKYAKTAKLIEAFLYSTDHEATRDG